ncbi:hypothetical protein [Aeromicrobium piscarium]|uniref:Uncharacterized protein n=1 Tax=Aeromicrobium piscarium TaxID=2590901 RepID=A0A554RX60_9ACTN|nr:hypothetical protein [Aeromicrobium piscarium]TSD58688.1 hypothetical protein FNM00_13595 [Aeromicrobium piscarium]
MDYRTFAEAYRAKATKNPWRGVDSVPLQLVEMHSELNAFGRLLHARLLDGAPTTPASFNQFSTRYVDKAIALEPIIREHHQASLATALEAAEPSANLNREEVALRDFLEDSGADRSTRQPHRHNLQTLKEADPYRHSRVLNNGLWSIQMFGHTQSQWYQALTDVPVHPDAWLSSQIGLANLAAVTIAQRERLYDASVFYLDELEPLRQSITGNLAEADALITLLEVARRQAGLTVIPAPPQFEAYAGPANADFLVLDLLRAQIIGVQVKSSQVHRTPDTYDQERIVLIDASVDLFGTLSRRTHLGRSDASIRSWPGMVTGHFLRGIQVPRPPWPWLNLGEFTAARQRVQNIAAEARDRNHEAEEIVRERVLTALGR